MTLIEICLKAACPRVFLLPDGAYTTPLARFLPCYSTATFGFVLADGETNGLASGQAGGCKSVSSGGPTDQPCYPATPPVRKALSASSRASKKLARLFPQIPEDYHWTLEEWLDLHEKHRQSLAQLESDADGSLHSFASDAVSTSETYTPKFEKAPETELLAWRGENKVCILVVAPQAAISQALASALYHRHAVGLVTPVLGLVVEPHSSMIRLAVAWLEDKPEVTLPGHLPSVHIALAAQDDSHRPSSFGQFNLAELHSALLFALCILAQKAKFDVDSELPCFNHGSAVPDRLAWRTDTLRLVEEEPAPDLNDFISSWASSVNDMELRGDQLRDQVPAASLSQKRYGSEYPQSTTSLQRQSREESFLCSEMASKVGDKDTPEPTWLWLQERHCVTVTLPSLCMYEKLEKRPDLDMLSPQWKLMLPHVQCYYNYLSLKTTDFVLVMPEVKDEALQGLRKELISSLRSIGISDNGPPSIAQKPLSIFLHKHCYSILCAVSDAQLVKRRSRTYPISEIEFRQCWDSLLRICLNYDEGSVMALYEQTIELPRNEVLDFMFVEPFGTPAAMANSGDTAPAVSSLT
ncbi:uncharacterized protein PHACADRAFT_189242, partial [Phanerochaete carnosa HHB-10118-sp]